MLPWLVPAPTLILGNSLCLSRLGSFSVMSKTQAPGRLSASLESGSGQQMSASVPHKVGSSTPITCRLFLVELFINLFVEQIGQLQLSPALWGPSGDGPNSFSQWLSWRHIYSSSSLITHSVSFVLYLCTLPIQIAPCAPWSCLNLPQMLLAMLPPCQWFFTN